MCGLFAILGKYKKDKGDNSKLLPKFHREMLQSLNHRGPDEQSLVHFGNAIFGHSRLSIIDLSTGSQPIYNEDQTIAVILNGEIYNFIELRAELEGKGHCFSTHSDTKVIVHMYEEVDEKVFEILNGMFAIVIYDRKNNTLLAGRDRAGEKPLIYWDNGNELVLASELKAILKHAEFKKEIDTEALALFFKCMYVPAPLTIFKNAYKLPPAHFLAIRNGKVEIKKYWDPQIEIEWNLSENEAVEEFIGLFSDSVKRRLVSDVPIGVFLSGGIDSSAVTAFMALNNPIRTKTYSVGFGDEVDERPFARMIAERYGTEHTELLINDNIEVALKRVIEYFDEPFGDSSAILEMVKR